MNLALNLHTPRINGNIFENAFINFNKYPKSPLRFPGGKARAVSAILLLIPSNINELISPFIGGGSIEIALASFGVKVFGFDNFDPLVIFWNELLTNPERLANNAEHYYPLSKVQFYNLQKKTGATPLESATIFYILNRASFSGATLSGGMTPGHPRFTKSSIEYLRKFKCPNLSVEKQDFRITLQEYEEQFLYLDPPYLIKSNLYGKNGNMHKNFNHESLYSILRNREKWVLSYNNCSEIKDIYSDFRIIKPRWKYGMSNDKNSRELIILSNDIPEVIGRVNE